MDINLVVALRGHQYYSNVFFGVPVCLYIPWQSIQ